MIWTPEAFERGCLGLSQAFGSMADNNNNNNNNNNASSWRLAPNGRYLVRRHQVSMNVHVNQGQSDIDQDNCDYKSGNEIYNDPDVVVAVESTQQHQGDDKKQQSTWEWHFSVIYSETWQAPVLYFHVHDLYCGEPCMRTQIVDYLTQLYAPNNVSDNWEFCSQDEHPVTRMPSFFLHPCRTNERLQHLSSASATAQQQDPALLLLQWMSLLLPSVGLAVSSNEFVKVSEFLAKNGTVID